MITPRRTTLVRVPNLHAFRAAIRSLADETGDTAVVVVPTRGAGRLLRTGVTRDELYDVLHARLADPPRRLTPLERDVMAQVAARAAAAAISDLPFSLRPGLVAEMLRFYDQLRRQSQQVNRFEELIDQALGSDELDRAAARMRTQTRFLAAAFRAYERLVQTSDRCDEHTLRERLIADAAVDPIRHVIVTVPDWIADADGLFVADFDLLTRIPGLERLELVCTERLLESGFHERLHNWWPGLDETRWGLGSGDWGVAKPVLVTPAVRESTRSEPIAAETNPSASKSSNPQPPLPNPPVGEAWFTLRDRDEELASIVRQVHDDRRRGEAVPLDRLAVVFKKPLPYLYAAAEVFRAAGIAYQAGDALPLAAEPTAAALDLILDAVGANFTRATLVALLRSPHFAFEAAREPVAALDRFLAASRYLGELERLESLGASGMCRPAFDAAVAIGRELAPLTTAQPASVHLQRLDAFWTAHLRPIADDDAFASRERRARAAITGTLRALAAVHAAHDDPDWTIGDAAAAVRRWIEEHTFVPDAAGDGIHLADDKAARYGDFDDIAIVGLVDADWPERPRRNIFYPPSLLKSLGWPSEKDRRGAADAHFLDLLGSARRRTMLSTFTLEDDALVSRSIQLDEIPRARLSSVSRNESEPARVFDDELLSIDPIDVARVDGEARAWAEMRMARSPRDEPQFHGVIASLPPRVWSVSAIETYLDCPFKFFAQHVLKLEEEPEDEEVMDPRRQGQFVHEVFERFFTEWQRAGHRSITPSNLELARAMFADVADRALQRLGDAEGALERTRLLGSPAAAGLGEAVFRMEAERPVAVVERLLERRLEGPFVFTTADGERTITVRGKADRIDLLEDGTFRLIDYKLGWPPNRTRALQLPIYSLCAEQALTSHNGRGWRLGEAAYLAFKGPKRVVPLFAPADRAKVLGDAQQRLADTVDAINRGEFPPTPDDVYRCETCSFTSVCRKDYVGDV